MYEARDGWRKMYVLGKGWLEKDVCVREGMVREGCVCDGRDG